MSAVPQPLQPGASLEASGCWNLIGVYGNGTCAELKRFVHCRHCPAYAAAGGLLLSRPLPAGYRQDWAAHFAGDRKLQERSRTSAILFRLGSEWLALATHLLQEVAERRPIHSLPHRRNTLVLGLANVRGELLVCFSLSHVLGLDGAQPSAAIRASYHRLLVMNRDGNRLGFPVDEVHGPHRFRAEELKPPPATLSRSNPVFTQNIFYHKERPVALLNGEMLFNTLNGNLS